MSATTPENNNQLWSRIVLFHAVEHTTPILLWGEPVDPSIDVGLALAQQPPQEVKVKVWEMANPEDDDAFLTDEVLTVKTLFCPMSTRRPRKPISSDAKDKSDKSLNDITKSEVQKGAVIKTSNPACLAAPPAIEVPVRKGPQLKQRSTGPLTLLDISQCPDCVTFSPAIKDGEEMHLALQFTTTFKAGTGPIAKEDAMRFVAGYTLVISSAIRDAGDTSDPGPDYHGIDAFCPFGPVLISPLQLHDPSELTVEVVINGEQKEAHVKPITLRDVQKAVKENTHGDILRGGIYSMMGPAAGSLRLKEPAIRLRKGDTVRIKASHGIGHLVNSIYFRRVPGPKLSQYIAAQEFRLEAEPLG